MLWVTMRTSSHRIPKDGEIFEYIQNGKTWTGTVPMFAMLTEVPYPLDPVCVHLGRLCWNDGLFSPARFQTIQTCSEYEKWSTRTSWKVPWIYTSPHVTMFFPVLKRGRGEYPNGLSVKAFPRMAWWTSEVHAARLVREQGMTVYPKNPKDLIEAGSIGSWVRCQRFDKWILVIRGDCAVFPEGQTRHVDVLIRQTSSSWGSYMENALNGRQQEHPTSSNWFHQSQIRFLVPDCWLTSGRPDDLMRCTCFCCILVFAYLSFVASVRLSEFMHRLNRWIWSVPHSLKIFHYIPLKRSEVQIGLSENGGPAAPWVKWS